MYFFDWRLIFVCFLASYISAIQIQEPINGTKCDTSSILNTVLLKLISALRRELQQDDFDILDDVYSKSSTAIEVTPTETAITETVSTTVWIRFRNERIPSIIVSTTVRSLLSPSPTSTIEQLMPSTKAPSLAKTRRIRQQLELEPSFSVPFDKTDIRDEDKTDTHGNTDIHEGLRVSEKVMDDPRVLEAVRTLKVALEEAYKLYSSKTVDEDKL